MFFSALFLRPILVVGEVLQHVSSMAELQVIDLATGGLKPDLTLFFDISAGEAIKRMLERDESQAKKNRMDEETAEFYTRVRNAYLGIAKREPDRFRVIDAKGPVEDIHRRVVDLVSPLLTD